MTSYRQTPIFISVEAHGIVSWLIDLFLVDLIIWLIGGLVSKQTKTRDETFSRMLRPRAAAAGAGAGANPYDPPNSTSDKDVDITTSHSYLTNVRTSNKRNSSSSNNNSKVTSSNSSKNNLPRKTNDGWSNHKESLFRSMIGYGIMVIGMFVGMIYVASSWHHRPHELIQLSIMNNSYNHKYGSSQNKANLNPNRKNDIRDNKNNLRSNTNDNGVKKTVRKDDKLAGDIVFHYPKEGRISRGEIGLPMERTPALVGAQPGKIQCDMMNDRHHVLDNLAYWNEPRGDRDRAFIKAPFQYEKATKTQYLTFEPDSGGWNNIRMSMESIFIFAAATGMYVSKNNMRYTVNVSYILYQRITRSHACFTARSAIILTESRCK